MQHPFWTYFWRVLGVIAGVFMLVTALMFWTAWRSSQFTPTGNGLEIKSGIDVIAIQLDILSLVIAVVAIGLAVAGFIGYQTIRDGAIKKAQETAENEVGEIVPPLIRREVAEFIRTFRETNPISDGDLVKLVEAAGKDGKEDQNGTK